VATSEALRDTALALLASLVIDDEGRRWGALADPVQWRDARAILTPDGEQPYHYITRSRGRSKTTDLAGVLIAAMVCQLGAGARCYAAASDSGQAGLLLDAFRSLVVATPELDGAFEITANRAVCKTSEATLDVLASDSSGSWGLRPAFLIVDEVGQWGETDRPRMFFAALRTAMGKVSGARLVLLTSAGSPSHWSARELDYARTAPLWRVHEAIGPPPWIPPDRLAEQRAALPESLYLRLFENRWTDSEDIVATRDAVLACRRADGALDPVVGRHYVTGVDLSMTSDFSVVATCHSRRDGDHSVVVVDRLKVWKPSRRQPVDQAAVESYIVETAQRYRGRVLLDPYQSAALSQSLRRQGISAGDAAMTQAGNNRRALVLHRLLRDGHLEIPGDDEDLVDELAGLTFREVSPGTYKLDTTTSGAGHFDRATAISIAAEALVERGEGPRLVLDSDDGPPGIVPESELKDQVGPVAYDRDRGIGGRYIPFESIDGESGDLSPWIGGQPSPFQ